MQKPEKEINDQKPKFTAEEALAEMKEFAKTLGINLIEVKPTEGKKTASIHFVRKPPKINKVIFYRDLKNK